MLLFLLAVLMAKSSFAWFANFCQFDRITWSPDGQKIAFESHYILTGAGYTYFDTLIVDLPTGKLTCVTPKVEQFTLSSDRKRMLFSSTYGLYIMDLESQRELQQLLFMDPTNSGVQLRGLAFSRVDGRILYLFDNIYSGIKQIRSLELETLNDTLLYEDANRESVRDSWRKLAGGLRPEIAKAPKGERSFPTRRKDRIFHFVKAKSSGGVQDLRLEDSRGETITTLLKDCKPRLFSWSPDSTQAILSVWMDDEGDDKNPQVRTYVVDADGRGLREIAIGGFSSLVWLLPDEFLVKTKGNLWRFNLKRVKRERLITTFVPQWCRKLSLPSRLYTIQIKEKRSYQTLKDLSYPTYWIGGGGMGIGGYVDSLEAEKTAENIRNKLKVDYRIVEVEANSIDLPVEFGFVESPQGDKVAFIRNDGYNGYWFSELWIMNPDGTDETRIVSYMANFNDRSYRPH